MSITKSLRSPIPTSTAATAPSVMNSMNMNMNSSMNSSLQSSSFPRKERQTNFKVVVRVRPPVERELSGETPFKNVLSVNSNEQRITISENIEAVVDEHGELLANTGPFRSHSFFFDYVYDQNSTQRIVFETTARGVVESALQGYNATIFAYGQTGTGKTYTMEGFNSSEGSLEARGIIPRAIEQIFGHIQRNVSPRMRFLVRASYLQIYNEQISDLLKPERNNLAIREDKKRGVYVEGLSEWVVKSPAEIYGLMQRGGNIRATGETKMNEYSSRSHAVFIVIAEQVETCYVDENGNEMNADEFNTFLHTKGFTSRREDAMKRLEDHVRQSFKVGKLNLVDLAGSERVGLSGATGDRLKESRQINKSLSALGNVIAALTDPKLRSHIPYRDSKLTRMLEDSLGGNCKTTMMAMISPALEAIAETFSTLNFANRAKNIKNEAKVNEDLDQKSLLRKYERELKILRAELEARSRNVVDKRRLLELDEQRKRAEADKMAAIRALEMRSREFMQEKEEKRRLEQRIAMLMGQMIRGERVNATGAGNGVGVMGEGDLPAEDNAIIHPGMQVIMKEQQDKLRQEYEGKLAELERERETIVEEKAQVDRYKQLLLKQRDIMIALTQRLVERDEQIVALQDELDAYDKHHRELEEKLDEKTALLIKFQRMAMEVNASSPYKNEELSKAMDAWGEHRQLQQQQQAQQMMSRRSELGYLKEDEEDDGDEDRNIIPANSTNQAQGSYSSSSSKGGSVDQLLQAELAEFMRRIKDEEKHSSSAHNNAGTGSAGTGGVASHVIHRQLSAMMTELSKKLVHLNNNSTTTNQSNKKQVQQAETKSAAEYDNLLSENMKLQQRIKQLQQEREHHHLSQQAAGTPAQSEALRSMQEKCDSLVKERQAVHTIMEQKIKVLVQSVSQAVSIVLQSSNMSNAGIALAKDVAALERLVNASIAALRNAQQATSNSTLSHSQNNSTRNEQQPTYGSSNHSNNSHQNHPTERSKSVDRSTLRNNQHAHAPTNPLIDRQIPPSTSIGGSNSFGRPDNKSMPPPPPSYQQVHSSTHSSNGKFSQTAMPTHHSGPIKSQHTIDQSQSRRHSNDKEHEDAYNRARNQFQTNSQQQPPSTHQSQQSQNQFQNSSNYQHSSHHPPSHGSFSYK